MVNNTFSQRFQIWFKSDRKFDIRDNLLRWKSAW
jgi:hypothetical protein